MNSSRLPILADFRPLAPDYRPPHRTWRQRVRLALLQVDPAVAVAVAAADGGHRHDGIRPADLVGAAGMSGTDHACRGPEGYTKAGCAACRVQFCRRRHVDLPPADTVDIDLDQGVAAPVSPVPGSASDPRILIQMVLTSIQAPPDARQMIMDAYDRMVAAMSHKRDDAYQGGHRIGLREGREQCLADVLTMCGSAPDRRHQANAHFRQPGP